MKNSPARRKSRRGRSIHGPKSISALEERVLEGFGGVSEYGITVRWDKNFLTLLHLTLARRDTASHLWRRSIWRNADDRRRLEMGLRSHRDRRRRGPSDDHRYQEQPCERHPQGVGFPDGAAAHRRIQANRAAEPAGASAGSRDRRRTDRDRYRNGTVCLLSGSS